MAIYGCLIDIWNGSKFCKWIMIYCDHKHALSLLHYNRHISSLTIRNHIDSKHCFTIWIKPSENVSKRNQVSQIVHLFLADSEIKTKRILFWHVIHWGWSYLNIQFFWGCGTISFVDDVQNLWMLSTRHNKITMVEMMGIISCIYQIAVDFTSFTVLVAPFVRKVWKSSPDCTWSTHF